MKNSKMLSKVEMKKVTGGRGGFCATDADCPDGDSCTNGVCGSGDSAPKIDACKGKKDGDSCSWIYKDVEYIGKCRSYMAQPLACSTLI